MVQLFLSNIPATLKTILTEFDVKGGRWEWGEKACRRESTVLDEFFLSPTADRRLHVQWTIALYRTASIFTCFPHASWRPPQ